MHESHLYCQQKDCQPTSQPARWIQFQSAIVIWLAHCLLGLVVGEQKMVGAFVLSCLINCGNSLSKGKHHYCPTIRLILVAARSPSRPSKPNSAKRCSIRRLQAWLWERPWWPAKPPRKPSQTGFERWSGFLMTILFSVLANFSRQSLAIQRQLR